MQLTFDLEGPKIASAVIYKITAVGPLIRSGVLAENIVFDHWVTLILDII